MLYTISRYLPYSNKTKKALIMRVKTMLDEGNDVLYIFKKLSQTFFSRRLRFVSLSVYSELDAGNDLISTFNKFPLLFDNKLMSLLKTSMESGSDLDLRSVLDVYIALNSRGPLFLKEVIIPNVPSIIFLFGFLFAIQDNFSKVLFPLYDLLEKNIHLRPPDALKVFVLSWIVFTKVLIPTVIGVACIPILVRFVRSKYLSFLMISYDFITYYIPPFPYLLTSNLRINFLTVVHRLSMSKVMLQNSLSVTKNIITNYFFKKNHDECLDLIAEGHSFFDSFKNSKLLSSEDKDLLFSSKDNLEELFSDLLEKYIIRSKIVRQTLSSFIRIGILILILYWVLLFTYCYVAISKKYLFK